MNKNIQLYNKYHLDRDYESLGLFIALAEKYQISNVMYPGCFVHITPSFIFPRVVYVDNYRNTDKFYNDPEVQKYVNKRKTYKQNAEVVFYKSDYNKKIPEKEKSFDLLISQYAGFISQPCKKYLKRGGIFVTNNSHGDASMAHLDKDFEFVGVYNRKTDKKFTISDKNLKSYFIPKKKGINISKAYLEKIQRGIGYTKTPSGYIFKKIK